LPQGGATQKFQSKQQAGGDQEDHDISFFFKVPYRPNHWPRSSPHGAVIGKQSTRTASRRRDAKKNALGLLARR